MNDKAPEYKTKAKDRAVTFYPDQEVKDFLDSLADTKENKSQVINDAIKMLMQSRAGEKTIIERLVALEKRVQFLELDI